MRSLTSCSITMAAINSLHAIQVDSHHFQMRFLESTAAHPSHPRCDDDPPHVDTVPLRHVQEHGGAGPACNADCAARPDGRAADERRLRHAAHAGRVLLREVPDRVHHELRVDAG